MERKNLEDIGGDGGYNIKIYIKYVGQVCLDWINLAQGRDVKCFCEHGDEPAGSVNCEKFCGRCNSGYSRRTLLRGFAYIYIYIYLFIYLASQVQPDVCHCFFITCTM